MKDSDFARVLAVRMHGDQLYGSKPYVFHLDQVAELVKPWGDIAETIAYLHDSIEDTLLILSTVHNLFGYKVADCVSCVTDGAGETREERKAITFKRLSEIGEKSHMALALVVKAADRLANVRMCFENDNARMLEIYRHEQPEFVKAVHRKGVNTQLVAEVDFLLSGKR